MKTFVNKKTGRKWIILDYSVVEGRDAWFIKSCNISLPKEEWEEKPETTKKGGNKR